ncbi:MAG: hypothetical protein G01um101470_400 [Parcubacteria group bacterium Gr01-1014_70]|nr:MAG: hypothetical protein G01um101470_400 [Parcubacteria group bacterium Gr01-1014_70]
MPGLAKTFKLRNSADLRFNHQMMYALTIALFSALGIAALYMRHVREVAGMTNEELAGVLQRERPLLTQAWDFILHTVRTVWYRHFREKTYAYVVKKISQIRILFMRMEQALFRFASRLRERTHSPKAPSDYWKNMQDWRKTVHWHKLPHQEHQPSDMGSKD